LVTLDSHGPSPDRSNTVERAPAPALWQTPRPEPQVDLAIKLFQDKDDALLLMDTLQVAFRRALRRPCVCVARERPGPAVHICAAGAISPPCRANPQH
jgi:hypothetical protein